MSTHSSNVRGGTPRSLQNLSGNGPSAEFIPQAGEDFVITPHVQDLTDRALAYLEIGYAVHLSGPAGTGKTTLALHIASKLGRKCTLIHGDDEFKGSDLLGKDSGYRRQTVKDNYVSSILKTEETLSLLWCSNRLTTACEQGNTLIYDEFTRSPATTNNAFLSILEEGILNIPSSGQDNGYIRVHPNFRAIFTSNPEEYVGVHKTQDALLDRMITLEVGHQDRETEVAIVVAKSKRSKEEATAIVDIIRGVRQSLGNSHGPTIRAALAISKIIDHRGCKVAYEDSVFRSTCQDVLYFNASRQTSQPFSRQSLDTVVQRVLSGGAMIASNALSTTGSAGRRKDVNIKPTSAVLPKQINAPGNNSIAETTVSAQIESSLHDIADKVNALDSVYSSPMARPATSDINLSGKESGIDSGFYSDEASTKDDLRDSISRRLPRPPMYDGNNLASQSLGFSH